MGRLHVILVIAVRDRGFVEPGTGTDEDAAMATTDLRNGMDGYIISK